MFRLFQFLANRKVVQRKASTWHISLKTLFFSPHSQIFGTDFLRSRCSIETTHQRLLTRACRPRTAFFSAVFLTHPAPGSAVGRLQPFVTWPVRAWLWLTGDGHVRWVSLSFQREVGQINKKIKVKAIISDSSGRPHKKSQLKSFFPGLPSHRLTQP